MAISETAMAILKAAGSVAGQVASSPWAALFGNLFPEHTVFGKIGRAQLNNYTQEHLTGAQQEANEFSAGEAQKNRNFQEQMANTTYQRTVSDLQSAGLNPALAMNNGASVPTPSGGAASSVAPAGSAVNLLDAIMSMKQLKMQEKLNAAQVNDLNASAEQKKSDAKLKDQSYDWNPKLNQALLDMNESRTRLTEEEITNAKAYRENIYKEGNLLDEQCKTEESKRLVNQGVIALNEASVREINALLPLKTLFLQAQTAAQRAQARLLWFQGCIQKGLFDNGYVTRLIDQADMDIQNAIQHYKLTGAEVDEKEILNKWNEWKRKAHSGELFEAHNADSDAWYDKYFFDFLEDWWNTGSTAVGVLSGLIEAGADKAAIGVGAGRLGSAAGSAAARHTHRY